MEQVIDGIDARDAVESRIRDVIRRAGIDPMRDSGQARQIIADTVTDYLAECLDRDQPMEATIPDIGAIPTDGYPKRTEAGGKGPKSVQ